jgi:hypothetical protein
MVREGKIIERGTYNQLMAMKGEISNLIKTAGNQESAPVSEASSSNASTIIDSEQFDADKEDEMEEAQEHLTQLQPIRPSSYAVKKRQGSTSTLRRASTASFKGPRGKLRNEEEPSSRTKQSKEFSEQGKVKWDGK